jgi:hypothetical protein
MGLFGGGGVTMKGPEPLSAAQFDETEKQARRLTDATPEEKALLAKLGISADQADQAMVEQIRELGVRGEDINKLDTGYMERAYKPAYDRLMNDYQNQNQGILESMNKRGVTGGPGGASEPEAYQQMLLQRSTQQTLGDNMLSAQNQAVQQKLAQYNARLAEPNLAATRYGQTMTPYQNLVAMPESERVQTRTGAAGNIYNAKLGYQSGIANINSQQKMQQNQNMMNMIGGGMGVASSALGALSDPALKKDREAGPDPEQDLAELSDTPVDRWKYRWEDESTPKHQGAMSDEAPEDVQAETGPGEPGMLDIPSYLGKLTNAVKALNTKMGAFDRLMAQQGGA